ncbi:MAG: hypothetical protein AB7N65_04340 [Vicinamibacterales bacterium]
MRSHLCLAVVGLVVAAAPLVQGQDPSAKNIVGVWRVAERTVVGPGAKPITSVQPGIRIFTQRHYSFTDDTSDTPRPELPANPTDKQRSDVFTPFTAQAGTYEIKGNEITFRRLAAKSPVNVRPGSFGISTFRFEGSGTLWLTTKANQSGPVASPVTIKLTRIE